jgi:hypothetical protein
VRSGYSRRRVLFALLLIPALSVPAAASAWTETLVESFKAKVDARQPGTAHVEVELGIRIKGGWLEGLEITGLDPELTISRDARPVLYSQEGKPHFPSVDVSADGSVWLRFPSSRAPRRGVYKAKLAYESPSAAARVGGGKPRIEYTIPGFRNGLDGAEIEFLAPKGARLPRDFAHSIKIRTSNESTVGGERFVFRRVHLPRTMSFTAALELPSEGGGISVSEGRSFGSLPEVGDEGSAAPSPGALLVALLMAGWAIAARAAHRRAARARGAVPKSLYGPESAIAHAALTIGAASGMAFAFAATPVAALALASAIVFISLERLPAPASPPRPGRFVAAHARMLRRSKKRARKLWLEPIALLDPLLPVGGAALVGAIALVVRLELERPMAEEALFTPLHGLFLLAALALSFGRTRLPRTPEERLIDVFREAARLTLPLDESAPLAISLAAHLDHDDVLQDARIRVHTKDRPNGLIRLDVSSVDRAGLGGFSPADVLIVVTRLGSEAEVAVARAFPDAAYQDAPGSRRARVLALGAAHETLVRAISTTAESPARARERVPGLAARLA